MLFTVHLLCKFKKPSWQVKMHQWAGRDFQVGTCEASRFDSISNQTSDSGFDS